MYLKEKEISRQKIPKTYGRNKTKQKNQKKTKQTNKQTKIKQTNSGKLWHRLADEIIF